MLNDDRLDVRAEEPALERRWPQPRSTLRRAVTRSALEVAETNVLQRLAHADDPDKPKRTAYQHRDDDGHRRTEHR